MKLEKWANLAEIVSGFAILATLIVLVLEVRGNSNEIRAANRQSIAARAQELALTMSTDEFLGAIDWYEIDDLQLTQSERGRIGAYLGAHFRNTEEAYLQFLDGRLDESYATTRQAQLLAMMDSELARTQFSRMRARGQLHPDFAEWMARVLAEQEEN